MQNQPFATIALILYPGRKRGLSFANLALPLKKNISLKVFEIRSDEMHASQRVKM